MGKWLAGLIAISVAMWAGSVDWSVLMAADFWAWRKQAVLLSGLVLFSAMAFSLVLAVRSRWLERQVGGLDRIYRLHKWTGIGCAVLLFLHWGAEKFPKWMVQAGWLFRPAKKGGGGEPALLHELAKGIGEWGLYLVAALLLIALLKLVPYRWFRYVHKVFPLVFIAFVLHGLELMPSAWRSQPAGLWTLACALAGSVAALLSLSGRIGRQRRHAGQVVAVRHAPAAGMLEVEVDLDSQAFAHAAGQFAFVTFDPAEGAHPFSIASATREDGRLRFGIKALGDYTGTLSDRIRPGQPVEVEGPYGGFDFSGPARQVWVAGGVGITPFLARLEALAREGGSQGVVDFYYCCRSREQMWPADLDARCRAAGVNLHLCIAGDGQRLDATHIASGWRDGERPPVWFCGPAPFAEQLQNGLAALGLPPAHFHREFFAMR